MKHTNREQLLIVIIAGLLFIVAAFYGNYLAGALACLAYGYFMGCEKKNE